MYPTRRLEGHSRELYSLIGPSPPPLTAHFTKPQIRRPVEKWEWRTFTNPARTDNLRLGHWVKASSDAAAVYPFAKYNIKPPIFDYSQDEYDRLLEDQEWSKEETDYLFQTVKEYEMRFYVVADRYHFPGGVNRTIDDIKDRYFSVCRRLIRGRPWAGDEASKMQLMSSFAFDKDREITRKKYITSLEHRTPDQIMEEETLYIEIKRLEQSERRFAKDRDDLLRTLGGVDSGLANLGLDDDSYSLSERRRKRGSLVLEPETPTMSSTQHAAPQPAAPVRRVQSVKSAAQDAVHCIHRSDNVATVPATKAAHTPVFLRSYKSPLPKTAMVLKISQALAELGITNTKLVMPTRENCQLLESLFEATAAMVETKKVIDRVDQDIKALEARKEAGAGRSGRSDAEGDEASALEQDDHDRRASSVADSTRSTGGRKRTQRSMSISSVDTTATSATRVSRKRQRN